MSNKKDVQVNINIKANTDGVDTAIHKVDRLLDQLFAKEKSLKSNNSLGNSLIPDGDLAKIDSAVNKLFNIRNELSNMGSTGGSGSSISTLNSEINKIEENAKKFGLLGVVVRENTGYVSEFDRVVDELNSDLDFSDDIDEFLGLGDSINTAGNALQDLDNSVNNGANTQNNLDNSLNNVSDSILDATIKYKTFTNVLNIGKKIYDEYCNTLEQVGEFALNAGGAIVDGFGQAIDVAERLIDITSEACAKFKTLADEGTELQKNWFKLYNYLGESGGGEYADYLGDLTDRLNIDADHILKSSEGILSMVSNLGVSADQVDDAMKAFTNMGLDLSAFLGGDVGDAMMQLESAVNLGLLNSRSAITRSLNLTYEDIEKFRELNTVQERANFILARGEDFRGNYEKWLQTAGGKVSKLNASLSSLTGTLQKMATGILAKFAPIITKIIQLLDKLANSIASVLGIDLTTAEANMSSGFDGIVSGAESASDALDDTTASAKALDRQVASFDDVIQLNDNKSSSKSDSSASGSEYSGAINTADWIKDWLPEPEKTPFEEWLDKLYDKLTKKQWSEAGEYIVNGIVDAFKKIDWTAIKDFVSGVVTGIVNFLKGLLSDGTLGETVGTGIAELVNIIVSGLNSLFVDSTLFENLGKSLAKGLHSLFMNLDTVGISTLLSNVVEDIFTTLKSFLDTMDEGNTWGVIGYQLSEIINGFFDDFTVEDVKSAANIVIRFIDGVITSIGTFMANLDTEDIKTKFTEFIKSLFTGFKDNQDEWASTLKELTDFIIDMINILITEWDSSGMSNAIIKFISDSGIGELVWDLLKAKFKVQFEKFEIEFLSGLEAFLGEILGVIGNMIGYVIKSIGDALFIIGGVLVSIGGYIVTGVGNAFSWIDNKADEFFNGLENMAETLGNNIGYAINGIVDGISGLFDWLWEKVTGIISGIGDAISSLWGSITSIPDTIGSMFSGVRNSLGFNIDIPFLANGAIVQRASLAVVGEAGKEAVIPLENNTGWMDSMANSLVNAMNNKSGGTSNAGGQVVLDMSKCTKQVYTRAEMMAFGRLITDALNTYGTNVAYNH